MTQIPKHGLQGAALPSDFSGNYNQLLFTIRQVLSKVNVAALCKVIAVYGGGVGAPPTVDLQPLVDQVDGYGNSIPHGVLHNVPVYRMQSGANAIILDPVIGDIGVAVFCDRDISSVKSNKTRVLPGSRRRFNVSDGLYFGGFLNGPPTQYIQFLSDRINIVSPEIDLSSWAGIVVAWPTNAAIPAGWLQCPTAQMLVNISTYPRLIVLGTAWGGDGVNTVGLPFYAAGYVPVQLGTTGPNGSIVISVGTLMHGTVIDHTHNSDISTQAAGIPTGAGGNMPINPIGSTAITSTPNSPQGGADNLAAGRGSKFIVKF